MSGWYGNPIIMSNSKKRKVDYQRRKFTLSGVRILYCSTQSGCNLPDFSKPYSGNEGVQYQATL